MFKEFSLMYLEELKRTVDRLPLDRFEEIFGLIVDAYRENRHIFVMGNGGSGTTASHLACDMNKGASASLNKPFRVICLNDNIPTMMAIANDVSYDEIFVGQLKNLMKPGDLIVGFSASGDSNNILKAIEYANGNGARTVGFTGFDGGKLAKTAQFSLIVPVEDVQKIEDVHLILVHMIMQNISNNGFHEA
jgi:D-sedoheptulose 7-phosphate isomerase